MNKLVKRGLSAYKIFLRNKLAGSLLMLMGGVMLSIGAFTGSGNDTKTLPSWIALAGSVFTCWSFYKLGYLKSDYDRLEDDAERKASLKNLAMQIIETLVYLAIAVVGLFLLLNESFTNTALNLMTGGFTIFNGVMGVINVVKNREKWDTFGWKFIAGLTLIELALGLLFIFMASKINIVALGIMGVVTTIAGVIEVISAIRNHAIEDAIKDSKDIVRVLKDEKELPAETEED